jgi:hypothetical protein
VINSCGIPTKAEPETKETPPGIARCAERDHAKAYVSIRDSLETHAKITDLSERQSRNDSSQITSTDGGITIAINPLREKVDCSIRDSFE